MAARVGAPFSYPGGKFRVAPLVWAALGDIAKYVEPFAGSLGVLLARPGKHDGFKELLNDANGHIVNVWRAIRADPEGVAWHLEGPATTADLTARHLWTHTEGVGRVAAVFTDPEHFDSKAAAWYIYGLAFSAHARKFMFNGSVPGRPAKNVGQGPHAEWRQPLDGYLRSLADRLKRAVIFAGDWSACVTPSALNFKNASPVGVFLDPPYSDEDRWQNLYGVDSLAVANDVRTWCAANGGNPRLRIVLAGYDGEHNALETLGWAVTAWSSAGGGESRHEERLWFSPHCERQPTAP